MWRTAVLAGGDAFTHHWIRGGHNASWRRGLRCEAHVLHESLHALLRCSLRACMSHMFSCSCVRPSFVGETISGGSCRHLLPRVHPHSPPCRRVVATSGHQTPTRTRMPSRVVMACGQLSSTSDCLSSTSRAPSLADAAALSAPPSGAHQTPCPCCLCTLAPSPEAPGGCRPPTPWPATAWDSGSNHRAGRPPPPASSSP